MTVETAETDEHQHSSPTLTDDPRGILPLTRELCTFRTSVVADDNENLFARLCKELPFKLQHYPSGASHNGWVIQPNWRVRKALLKKDGKVLFDGTANALGVAMNSRSFNGELDREALEPHLVTNPELHEAHMYHSMWQIRNWDPDWALCVPYRIYKSLGPGTYVVELVTETEPGEMIVAEYEKPGRSNKVILFNTNTCHPTQANDGFAAVAMLVRLFQWLKDRDTYYTYRLILAPEHLGSTFYMRDRSPQEIEDLVSCIFAEMPGTEQPITVASTFLGDQMLDKACRGAVRRTAQAHRLVPWRSGVGNDEVVWEAPGYEVPTVEITRGNSQERPYPEYHSSLDNPDLMQPKMIYEFLGMLEEIVKSLEANATARRKFDGLICLSNPEYNLYFERPDPAVDKGLDEDDDRWGRLLHSLFRYLDGSMSILDIADKHELPFDALLGYMRQLEEAGLITMEFKPIERPAVTRALGNENDQ